MPLNPARSNTAEYCEAVGRIRGYEEAIKVIRSIPAKKDVSIDNTIVVVGGLLSEWKKYVDNASPHPTNPTMRQHSIEFFEATGFRNGLRGVIDILSEETPLDTRVQRESATALAEALLNAPHSK